MPCWERRTQTLDVGAMDFDVLMEGLTADGWYIWTAGDMIEANQAETGALVRWYRGSAKLEVLAGSLPSATRTAQDVKKAYTRGAFKVAAKRFGFTVATNRSGRTVATRRRYSR